MTTEQKIKMLLGYAGISQAELARRLGDTPSNFNHRLKKDNLKNKDLQQIAELLGCEWRAEFILPDGTRI